MKTFNDAATKTLAICIRINQQDAQNSCGQNLYSIDALHVSDSLSPSSGAIFLKAVHRIWYTPIRLAVVDAQNSCD